MGALAVSRKSGWAGGREGELRLRVNVPKEAIKGRIVHRMARTTRVGRKEEQN